MAKQKRRYMTGWIHAEKPIEPTIRFAGYAWSTIYVTVRTKRIFKQIKNTGEWLRFAVVEQED